MEPWIVRWWRCCNPVENVCHSERSEESAVACSHEKLGLRRLSEDVAALLALVRSCRISAAHCIGNAVRADFFGDSSRERRRSDRCRDSRGGGYSHLCHWPENILGHRQRW